MVDGIHWIFMIHCMNGVQWTNVNSCYAIWVCSTVLTPFNTSTSVFIDILNLVHSNNNLSNVSFCNLSCVSYILTNVSISHWVECPLPTKLYDKYQKPWTLELKELCDTWTTVAYKKCHNKCTNPLKILLSEYLRTRELYISLVRTWLPYPTTGYCVSLMLKFGSGLII